MANHPRMTNDPVIAAFRPVILALAGPGRRAVSLGGSRAKGRTDALSDYDFRLYADAILPRTAPAWDAFRALWVAHERQGIRIDGVWDRLIPDIDAELDLWVAGHGRPTDLDWAVWGYYLPTDLAHQIAVDDPDGIMAGWRARLVPYPDGMATAIVARWMEFLRYWRDDYHYQSKVARGDPIFLAGLTAKLVHAIMQVIFAANRVHFPGDGWNLDLARPLALQPADLEPRLRSALASQYHAAQRAALVALITELDGLLPATSP
jgi:hypothetical protein